MYWAVIRKQIFSFQPIEVNVTNSIPAAENRFLTNLICEANARRK